MTSKPPINDPDRPDWELQKAVEETQQVIEKRTKKRSRFEELFENAANLIADRLSETVREALQPQASVPGELPADPALEPSSIAPIQDAESVSWDATAPELPAFQAIDGEESRIASAPALQFEPIDIQPPREAGLGSGVELVTQSITALPVNAPASASVDPSGTAELPELPSPFAGGVVPRNPPVQSAAGDGETLETAASLPPAASQGTPPGTPPTSEPVVAETALERELGPIATSPQLAAVKPKSAEGNPRGLPSLPFGLTPSVVGVNPSGPFAAVAGSRC